MSAILLSDSMVGRHLHKTSAAAAVMSGEPCPKDVWKARKRANDKQADLTYSTLPPAAESSKFEMKAS